MRQHNRESLASLHFPVIDALEFPEAITLGELGEVLASCFPVAKEHPPVVYICKNGMNVVQSDTHREREASNIQNNNQKPTKVVTRVLRFPEDVF